ncbi:MAG: glycosyl hydrolase family 17 protein [Limnobacter sp.]|nr:glycosyl hydrolase family 17 protein [Limnobacter sp.]
MFGLITSLAGFFNRPVLLGTSLPPDHKVNSFSFAPYYVGYSPLERKFPTTAQIRADIELISGHTDGLRTYSSREGLDKAHALIQQNELNLIQGAWLTHNDSIEGRLSNHHEVTALIQAAREHPETVKRVIVGNEVLLRGDMEIEPLIQYIRTVRQAIDQPVSYADVWSLYLKHPELINEVDFITIHILPYWEDEPIAVEKAPQHLLTIIEQVKKEAQELGINKPILIGETGWPAQGRQRGQAVPSPENQAFYIREVVRLASLHNIDYNLVEAFNQPWKSKLEGKVGAHWGMFDANRNAVFALSGPVQGNPDWLLELIPGFILALLFLATYHRDLKTLNGQQAALLTGLFSLLFTLWGQYIWREFIDCLHGTSSWALAIPQAALAGVTVWLQSRFFVAASAGKAHRLVTSLEVSQSFVWLAALFFTVQMGVYGRYLEFQTDWLMPVAIGAAGVWALSKRHTKLRLFSRTESKAMHRVKTGAFLGSALWLLVGEVKSYLHGRDFQLAHPELAESIAYALFYTFTNTQLLIWLVCLLALSIALKLPGSRSL